MRLASDALSLEYIRRPRTTMAAALDSLYDGVYIVDRQRRIVFWNRGAELITGYPRRQVLGRRCSEGILSHIDENGRLLCKSGCPLLGTLLTGKPHEAKVYPLHKGGGRLPTQTHVAALRDGQGRVFAGIEVFRDISKEEELRVLQEKFAKLIRRYVSSSTYDQVRDQSRRGARGARSEMRELTVLYLDVVGFTALSESSPPREVVALLNEVFGICEVITKECAGDIDKFIGDAVMAVFVDANDAVRAGRIILSALARMNRRRRCEGRQPVRVRIGANSGRVLQGDIGAIERKDRTVIGDVVNTAARVQTAAEPGAMFVSEAVHARLNAANRRLFIFHDRVKAKGKSAAVPVYRMK
ncbi:MAG: adenylate/guanylate cyclase domain-containing protein [Elusimicrobia bacterium]|nr:adenylate/guanylate cyclase domain-containing protein [Elusimicrobiota bacterium]